jgi:hypothetical protein
VLEAFAAGCGGKLDSTLAQKLQPGDAAFYGVRPGWLHLWNQAKVEKRNWYWLDNSWFDSSRETMFRVGCNAVQSWSHKLSTGTRLARLGVRIRPWQKRGAHIVVCNQSDEFMRTIARWPDGAAGWQRTIVKHLQASTERKIVVRDKQCPRPLAEDLKEAWLLITHSSAAAIEALISGVPVIVTDRDCASAGFSTPFDEIERPHYRDGREGWAARLADSQWTLQELRTGAWLKQQVG